MVDGAPAFRVPRVVQPTAQVLYVLPRGQPRPVCAVEVGRKPLACLQVHVGHHEMQLCAVMVTVLYPDHGQPVRVHPRNQKIPLETVDQLKADFRGVLQKGGIVLGEAQHPRRISLGEPQRINQRGHRLRIAAKQLRGILSAFFRVVLVTQQVGKRPAARPATVLQDLRQHSQPPARSAHSRPAVRRASRSGSAPGVSLPRRHRSGCAPSGRR